MSFCALNPLFRQSGPRKPGARGASQAAVNPGAGLNNLDTFAWVAALPLATVTRQPDQGPRRSGKSCGVTRFLHGDQDKLMKIASISQYWRRKVPLAERHPVVSMTSSVEDDLYHFSQLVSKIGRRLLKRR
jgi:hypothetical protein